MILLSAAAIISSLWCLFDVSFCEMVCCAAGSAYKDKELAREIREYSEKLDQLDFLLLNAGGEPVERDRAVYV